MKVFSSALTVVFVSFFSVFANAQAVGQWNLVAESAERVYTRGEFVRLQERYPDQLGGYDADAVAQAAVAVKRFRYFGATTCPKNDPRLIFEQVGYNVCLLPHYGAPCSGAIPPVPFPRDPCFAH